MQKRFLDVPAGKKVNAKQSLSPFFADREEKKESEKHHRSFKIQKLEEWLDAFSLGVAKEPSKI